MLFIINRGLIIFKDKLNTKVIIFDGVCLLCNEAVYFLHRKLRYRNYNILPSQSNEGKLLLDRYKLHEVSKETIILISNNNIFTKSDALLEIIDDMPLFWYIFKIFKIFPKNVRDFVYSWISRHRHLIFGKIK